MSSEASQQEEANAAAPLEALDGGDESQWDRSTLSDAGAELQRLVEIVWRLRQPDGCPWDRKQTHASIAKNFIEETYEAVDCIEANDPAHLREELGDVLMQVALHAQIAADAGEFTMADVAHDINEKLVRRHPHVFGELKAREADEVLKIWEQVKLKEKEAKDADAQERPESLMASVPTSLPALMQAQKVSRKAAAAGFEWDDVSQIWDKFAEEHSEFDAEAKGSPERALEFGDMLFVMVNIARREGIDAESALRDATNKFRRRWDAIEEGAWDAHGHAAPQDLSMDELQALWDEAKAKE